VFVCVECVECVDLTFLVDMSRKLLAVTFIVFNSSVKRGRFIDFLVISLDSNNVDNGKDYTNIAIALKL
jgi:hypothetical protein